MVEPVERDARGIIAPDVGLTRFDLDRHDPSPPVARFVDRYWIVRWDLRGQEPHTQRVLAHPVVNVVFAPEGTLVNGVTTRLTSRTLDGQGRALGVMFRPAGFRPFLGRPLSTITDRQLPIDDVYGVPARSLQAEIESVDAFLAARVPDEPQPSEDTTALVERVAADPYFVRVDTIAKEVGVGLRQLQRRFADHVGISPKAVVRRYRLYEAAERARAGAPVDWAGLAAELGYSDQAHLTRDFTAVIGTPPHRYSKSNTAAR